MNRDTNMPTREVALIMNVNKPYDRKVIAGIGRFVQSAETWRLYVEDEPLAKMPNLKQWNGDGIIANFDDEAIVKAVSGLSIPVVGMGGAVVDQNKKAKVPYVATDNSMIGRLGAQHLLDCGFKSFAFCGVKETRFNPWSKLRGEAFKACIEEAGFSCSMYAGPFVDARKWEQVQKGLTDWLSQLEKPLGLMACNDTRARHVIESCRRLKLNIPEDVAIVGVDDDEVMCELAVPSLSSVRQGTDRIGYEAAKLLDQLMRGRKPRKQWIVIEPTGVAARRSSDVLAVEDDDVATAMRFIREQLAHRPRVYDVAAKVNLSRSTLDAKFKETLGRTVHDEIESVRMRRTKDMLLKSDIPLKTIAVQCGYGNIQYMTKVFRDENGITPGAFRKENKV